MPALGSRLFLAFAFATAGFAGGVAAGLYAHVAAGHARVDQAAAGLDVLRAEALEVVNAADSGLSRALNAQDRIARLLAQLSTVPGQEQARAELDAAVAKLKADVTPRAETVRAALLKLDPPSAMPDPAKITDQANADFLAAYAARPDVTRSTSGLMWRAVNRVASGPQPTAASEVAVRYRGTFIDGTEFDSNAAPAEPAVFGLDKLIPGWTEGVPQMRVGETFEFVIPYGLAYGVAGRGPIPPRQTLIFTVELLEVKSNPAPKEPPSHDRRRPGRLPRRVRREGGRDQDRERAALARA